MRKPTFWFPTLPDTNQAVHLQKMARGLNFGRDSREIGGTCVLYYSFSESKGVGQLQGSASLFSYIQNVVFL